MGLRCVYHLGILLLWLTLTSAANAGSSSAAQPKIATCTLCHRYSLDNGDGVPLGGRPPIVTEALTGGHPYNAGVFQAQNCETCHDIAAHGRGQVMLKDTSTTGGRLTLTANPHESPAEAARVEGFCRNCHANPAKHAGASAASCTLCHRMHEPFSTNLKLVGTSIRNQTLGVNKSVVFTALTGANSFNDGEPALNNGICQVCHTSTRYHRQDGTGATHHEGQNCTQCHDHAAGFAPTNLNCVDCHQQPQDNGDGVPVGGRRAITRADGAGGHLHSGPAFAQGCETCHDLSQHTQGIVRLRSDQSSQTIVLSGNPRRDPTQASLLDGYCRSCHANNEKHLGGSASGCTLCHDLHDPSSSNLALVGTVIRNQKLGVDRPVVFTATSGPHSFDDGDSAANDGICQVCHTTTQFHKQDGSATKHYDGQDCTQCHTHSAGFLPGASSCTDCHKTAQDNGDNLPPGGRRAVVNSDGTGGHVHAGGAFAQSGCETCHDQSQHSAGVVRLKDLAHPGQTIAVTGDALRNPAQAELLEPFCVTCHADARKHVPLGPNKPSCTQCHALHDPTESNLALVSKVVRSPQGLDKNVVFRARTGANSFDDGNPASNDGICQVCHTATEFHRADGSGAAHHAGEDCATCHTHEGGFLPIAHGAGAGINCNACHGTHREGMHEAGLPTLPRDDLQANACKVCHMAGAPARNKTQIANHVVNRGSKIIDCGSCHDPHAPQLATDPHPNGLNGPNRDLVRADMAKYLSGAVEPAIFQKTPDHLVVNTAPFDGVCQSCHTQTAYYRKDGTGAAHHPGADCTQCHKHEDGFLPTYTTQDCVACHSQVQGIRSAVVTVQGTGGHTHSGGPFSGTECQACHEMSRHKGGTIRLKDSTQTSGVLTLAGDVLRNPAVAASLEGFCKSCHADLSKHTPVGMNPPNCTQCHDLHDPASSNLALVSRVVRDPHSSADKPVVFTARTGANSFDDGDPAAKTGICQVCHQNTAFHKADGSSPAHYDGQDCTTCHTHLNGFLPDTSFSCVDCHKQQMDNGDGIPVGGRPPIVKPDGSSGHPHQGGVLTAKGCESCHDQSLHRQGVVRLKNPAGGSIAIDGDSLRNPALAARIEPLCVSCHATDHSHVPAGSAASSCTQCHDLHNPQNVNLSLISPLVHNQVHNEDRPVVFTARSGSHSFDDGDPAANDGICQVCHTTTAFHREDGSSPAHFPGQTCTQCHTHERGFIPQLTTANCIACHQQPQDNGDGLPLGGRRQIVTAAGTGGHVYTGGAFTGQDCEKCHNLSGHRQGVVRIKNPAQPTDPNQDIVLNGDPRKLPEEAAKLDVLCKSCHSAPQKHLGSGYQSNCTLCHDLHNPTGGNLSLVASTIRNQALGVDKPVVFSARSGLNSFADADPAVHDGICEVCHTATSFHRSDGGGAPHFDGEECTACHTHDSGFIPYFRFSCTDCHKHPMDDGDGKPAGGRSPVVKADGGGGHTHTGGDFTAQGCETCHDQTHHREGQVVIKDRSQPGAQVILTGDARTSPTQANKLESSCRACHTAQHKHTPGADQQPNCTLCHDLHDPANTNLALIGATVRNPVLNIDKPVVFTARSGSGSFDDGDPAANNGICQVCHDTTLYHRADGSSPDHFNGQTCTQCHQHANGFMPQVTYANCIECHSKPQDNGDNVPVGGRAATIKADGSGGHQHTGGVFANNCETCHNMAQHTHGQVRLKDLTQPANPAAVVVLTGDPSTVPAEADKLEGFCKSCHVDPNKHQPDNAAQPNCTLCHDIHNPTNTNLSLVASSVRNQTLGINKPVVFTALTGAHSFDDGDPTVNDGICQVCHTATNYHRADGSGATHNPAQNCTTCHSHHGGFISTDSQACTACHNTAQGSRRAVTGEFGLATHHLGGATVNDTDCVVCHEMTQHRQGHVRLKNVDDPANPSLVVALNGNPAASSTEAAKLEAFCLACHDANAAAGAAPFSDGINPKSIDKLLWSTAAHKLGGSAGPMTCFGDGNTFGCHASGHGSAKKRMLAPANASQPAVNGDAKREEEGMCYTCHDADGPARTNMQASFALATHHKVSSLEQTGGAKVECVNCHNPHAATSAAPLANPETSAPWTGTGVNFCLVCHDGAPPAGVTFPATSTGTGWNKSRFAGTTHATKLGPDSCRLCHVDHGSANTSMLKQKYVITDNNTYTSGDGDYAACWACHNETQTISQSNAFGSRHDLHVRDKKGPCIICHDTHGGADAAEPGLIDFSLADRGSYTFSFTGGRNASTAFYLSTDKTRGYCYLSCHGESHNPYSFTHTNVSTVNCLQCHATQP